MAKAEAKGSAGKEGGGGSKKGLITIILAAVVVLAAGGGGAWWYFTQSAAEHAEEPAEEGAKAPKKKKKKESEAPVFMSLESMVVNLMPHEAEQYLQVGIDLKVAEPKVTEEIKLHMPEVRSGLLVLLSSKRGEELASTEGKQKLAQEVQDHVNKVLGVESAEEGVTGVFFTSFVIQ